MKHQSNLFLLLGTAFIIFSSVHCSQTSNGSGSSTSAATTCSSGYLYSSYYGCQVQCGTNMISYSGQCISTTTSLGTTTANTTCASGYLYSSTYGCQVQCGTNAIYYNGQCITLTTTTTTYTTTSMCQGTCAAGYTQTQGQCLPNYSCGACYGYYQGYCYIGDYATAYYGY